MMPVFGLANQAQQGQVGTNTSNATSAEAGTQKESPNLTSVAGGSQVVSAQGAETAEAVKPTPVTASPVRVDFSADMVADMVAEPKDPAERSIPITGPDELAKTLAMETQREREAQSVKEGERMLAGEREQIDAQAREAESVKDRKLEAMPLPGTDRAVKQSQSEPGAASPVIEADKAADEAYAEAIQEAKIKEQISQMQESVNVVRGEGAGMADTELAAA